MKLAEWNPFSRYFEDGHRIIKIHPYPWVQAVTPVTFLQWVNIALKSELILVVDVRLRCKNYSSGKRVPEIETRTAVVGPNRRQSHH